MLRAAAGLSPWSVAASAGGLATGHLVLRDLADAQGATFAEPTARAHQGLLPTQWNRGGTFVSKQGPRVGWGEGGLGAGGESAEPARPPGLPGPSGTVVEPWWNRGGTS